MYLRELVLVNFRSIPSATIPFTDPRGAPRPWTLLVGDNGTGKSTLLRAVALLLGGTAGIKAFLGAPADWIRNGCGSARLQASLCALDGSLATIELKLRRRDTLEQFLKLESNRVAISLIDRALAKIPPDCFTAGFGASRGAYPHPGPTLAPAPLALSTLFSPDGTCSSLGGWAAALEATLPAGTAPGEARGLVLIDELELHLAPRVAREIRHFLSARFPLLQFVASTHSPLVAQQAAPGELFHLQREESGRRTVRRINGSARHLRIHELLASPLFGLDTLDSVDVAATRAEYRRLRDGLTRDAATQDRLEELRRQLSAAPQPSTRAERRRGKLLSRIAAQLGAMPRGAR